MKKLASPFVVTALGFVACTPEPHTNPPRPKTVDVDSVNPPEQQVASAEPTATPPKNDRVDYSDYPRTLNANDGSGKTVFRGWGDKVSCYVELPWPKGQPRMPGQIKTQDIPCPAPMQADAWKACPGGTISANKDSKDDCACFQMGNPPPIPHKVPCP
jgi:hypothetical protein